MNRLAVRVRREPSPQAKPPLGFTLIELLIVVAIIAILAAIAVPNFLEAQTRSKVGRTRSDLRTVATGLEAYQVDHNHYPPNDGVFNVLPRELSTPVAYLTSSVLFDPFNEHEVDAQHGLLIREYTYMKIVDLAEGTADAQAGRQPANEAIDATAYNPGALSKYGKWRLVGFGPDRAYSALYLPALSASFSSSDPIVMGADIAYDPSNGTVSFGNLLRTQREVEARLAK